MSRKVKTSYSPEKILFVIIFSFGLAWIAMMIRIDLFDLSPVRLSVDEGITVYQEDPDGGERIVYERYRFCRTIGLEIKKECESIDISKNNATLTLNGPNQGEEDVTSDLWVYLMEVIPPSDRGRYELTANLVSGEVYKRSFEFKTPIEVEIIKADITKEENNKTLSAFMLDDIDLKSASSVFHIYPTNAVYGGYTPVAGFDQYIWLDLDEMALFPGEHIFMAKIDGRWYYSIENYPDDFYEN